MLKKLTLITIALIFSGAAYADQYVDGYTRKDGTYVQPHFRSEPDGQRWNNYSTKGNTNPYTGKRGTKPLFKQPDYGFGKRWDNRFND